MRDEKKRIVKHKNVMIANDPAAPRDLINALNHQLSVLEYHARELDRDRSDSLTLGVTFKHLKRMLTKIQTYIGHNPHTSCNQ